MSLPAKSRFLMLLAVLFFSSKCTETIEFPPDLVFPVTCPSLTVSSVPTQYIIEIKDETIRDSKDFDRLKKPIEDDLATMFPGYSNLEVDFNKKCGCDLILVDLVGGTIGPEESETEAIEEPEDEGDIIRRIGRNFPIKIDPPDSIPPISAFEPAAPNENIPFAAPDAIKVAITDTGADFDHMAIMNWISYNMDDPADIVNDDAFDSDNDDDGNCLINDFWGFDFANADQYIPLDSVGHGTHIAGIVSQGYPDAAPPLRLMIYKVLKVENSSLFDAVCGIREAVKNGAVIINTSWGYYGEKSTMLQNAIEYAAGHGVLVVTSAGNKNMDVNVCDHWPSGFSALYNNVISVAALDYIHVPDCGEIILAAFSNFGTKIDIAAPGYAITNAFPDGDPTNNNQETLEGTSMAAAFVSREAALLKAGDPTLTPVMIKQHIINVLGRTLSNGSKKIGTNKWLPPSGITIYDCP